MYVLSRRLSILCCLLFLGACATTGAPRACDEDALVGAWKADWIMEIWTFEADGGFTCTGLCNFGPDIGEPVTWAGDPTANLWASDVDYIRLDFTNKAFEGTIGAFRCVVLNNGRDLLLEPIAGLDLTFTRVGFVDRDTLASP